MHELNEAAQVARIRLGEHAVAEVEDVARAPANRLEDPQGGRLDPLPRAEQQRRLEVPLHAAFGADELPGAIDRDPPIDADHVAAGLGHLLQQVRGPSAEVDRRHVDRSQHLR